MRGKRGAYLSSIALRTSSTVAPDAVNCIESRATSMHTAQPSPCGSQAATLPSALRDCTKQCALARCPADSQPQKQGTNSRTSGRRPANSYASVISSAGRGAMLGMNGYGGAGAPGGGTTTSTGS